MQGPYYVYFHIRPDNGKIFYIGKGKGDRCETRAGRSAEWCNVVLENNGSFEINIACDNLIEEDAFLYERYLIDFCGREVANADLVNKLCAAPSQSIENLIAWINDHPLIKISPLAGACGIGRANMNKFLKEGDIPEKHRVKIEQVLKDYGYCK